MRSDSKYRSFIRCGLNPHPNHFVHKYLKLFIDQKTGFAIKDFAARPCYYIFDQGEIVTGWSYDELVEKYPSKNPRKFTFVPSSIEDNKFMLSKNETYVQDLEANDPANAAMLLSGNWKYTISPNGVWDRSVIKGQIVSSIPVGCSLVRAWDKAASKPAKEGGDSKTLDPDYTCSIGFARSPDKFIYVFGNYVDDNTGNQRARFREKPGIRDTYIMNQCKYDGTDVIQILPCDLGQGGKFEYQESAKVLQSEGITVKQDPSISNISKMKRFDPFVSACYNGLVFWVKDSFSPEVWDYMLLELENFNPLTRNNGFHDDLVDCFSSAYAASINNKVHRAFTLPSHGSPTALSIHKTRIK